MSGDVPSSDISTQFPLPTSKWRRYADASRYEEGLHLFVCIFHCLSRELFRSRRHFGRRRAARVRARVQARSRRADQRVLSAGQDRRASADARVDEAAPARRVSGGQQRHGPLVRRHAAARQLEPGHADRARHDAGRGGPAAVRDRRRRVGRREQPVDQAGTAELRALPARLQRRRDRAFRHRRAAVRVGQRRDMAAQSRRRRAGLRVARHGARRRHGGRRRHRQAHAAIAVRRADAAPARRSVQRRDAAAADHAREPVHVGGQPRSAKPERVRIPELQRQAARRLLAIRHLLRP
ncbi:putative lipo domain protein [Burkholderia pseudomallei]|nr:putative lipo domain protein [Burkholderia pseudomallei]